MTIYHIRLLDYSTIQSIDDQIITALINSKLSITGLHIHGGEIQQDNDEEFQSSTTTTTTTVDDGKMISPVLLSLFHHVLQRLASLSFPNLTRLYFHDNLIIDLKAAKLVHAVFRGIMKESPKFMLWNFIHSTLSTDAIVYLSLLAQRGNADKKKYYGNFSPRFGFVSCRWLETQQDNDTENDSLITRKTLLHGFSFPHDFKLTIHNSIFNVETTKASFQCFQKLANLAETTIQQIQIQQCAMSIESFKYMQLQDTFPLDYTTCTLHRDDVTTTTTTTTTTADWDRPFSFYCDRMRFTKFRIDLNEAKFLFDNVINQREQNNNNDTNNNNNNNHTKLLKRVEFYDVAMTIDAVNYFMTNLFPDCTHCVEFSLCKFDLSPSTSKTITTMSIPISPEIIWTRDGIVKIKLPRRGIHNKEMMQLVMELIAQHPPFTSINGLRMTSNLISGDLIYEIVKYLNQTNISLLDFSLTDINNHDLEMICQSLRSNTTVTMLNLSETNSITDIGLRHLIHALQTDNMTLQNVEYKRCNQLSSSSWHDEVKNQLQYLLALNRLGRKQLLQCNDNTMVLPVSLFAYILEQATTNNSNDFVYGTNNDRNYYDDKNKPDSSCVYWMLQTFPHYLFASNISNP